MKKPSPYAIKRAKRTLFGRVLCRLVGEQTGAVMMEYVVIGVLVVAAAVAMVLAFGKGIRESFWKMIEALLGHPDKVVQITTSSTVSTEAEKADTTGSTIAGGSGGSDTSSDVVVEDTP